MPAQAGGLVQLAVGELARRGIAGIEKTEHAMATIQQRNANRGAALVVGAKLAVLIGVQHQQRFSALPRLRENLGRRARLMLVLGIEGVGGPDDQFAPDYQGDQGSAPPQPAFQKGKPLGEDRLGRILLGFIPMPHSSWIYDTRPRTSRRPSAPDARGARGYRGHERSQRPP